MMVSTTPAFLLLLLLPLSLQGLLRWVGFPRSQIDNIVNFFKYKSLRQSELNNQVVFPRFKKGWLNQPFFNLGKIEQIWKNVYRFLKKIRNKAKLVALKRDFRHGELMMKCNANIFILFWINDQYSSRRTEYRLFHTRIYHQVRWQRTWTAQQTSPKEVLDFDKDSNLMVKQHQEMSWGAEGLSLRAVLCDLRFLLKERDFSEFKIGTLSSLFWSDQFSDDTKCYFLFAMNT